MKTALGPLLVAVALAAAASPGFAEVQHWRAGLELGGAWRSGDTYAEALPFVEYGERLVAFGLGAPIRARMLDGSPKDGCATPGLRCQDWDQPGDWLRILRHLDLGDPQTTAQVHVGDLTGVTIGHGSTIWRYYNNLLMDNWRTGLHVIAQGRTWGIAGLVGDITRFDVMVLRASGRPFAGAARPLEFGLQVAMDRREFLAADQAGVLSATNSDLQGETRWTDHMTVSADLGWTLKQSSRGLLAAWLDGVVQTHPGGAGLHAGLRFASRGQRDSVALSLEGRYAGEGYVPAKLGPLYELQWPTIQHVQAAPGLGSRLSAEWAHVGIGRIYLALDQQTDQKLNTFLWLASDPSADLSLRAFVGRQWLGAAPQRWGPPSATASDPLDWLAWVAAKLRVQGPWYASLSGGRRWRAHQRWAQGQSPVYAELEVRLAAGAEARF